MRFDGRQLGAPRHGLFGPGLRALRLTALALIGLAGGFIAPAPSLAQTTESSKGRQPEALKDTGVEYKLGQSLDPTILFRDEDNNSVAVGEFFDGKRPTLLSFNYSNCPGQCSVQLEKITLALRQIDFNAGVDFQLVSVSIDPNEQSVRARQTKEKYTNLYNRPGTEGGWHFLTGEKENIRKLADQCGVKYKYIPHQKLFSHPPVFLLISPDGKIVRYIEGFDYISGTVKLALVDAAAGKIGSPLIFLTYVAGCFVYDETTGRYTVAAVGIMRLAGAATALVLLTLLLPYWLIRRPKTKGQPASRGDAAPLHPDAPPVSAS
jgi:protein SCO1/2